MGLLLFIFVLAYFLRVLFLPNFSLTFGYDQARDALHVLQILSGDLKILGPPSSTPGLYHGVFYFYFLAPAYFLGQGSPIVAAYWVAFWNALTIFLVFFLGYFLTKRVSVGLLSAFLFAISFEATQYAIWLSNPTIAAWTVPLAYLGLWLWLKDGRRLGPILAGVGLGLSIQADIFLAYHIPSFMLLFFLSRRKIWREEVISFFIALLLALSPMIISEIKFGFRSLNGIVYLLTSGDKLVSSYGFGDFIVLYFNQLGKVFSYNLFPFNVGYGSAFVLVLLFCALSLWFRQKTFSWNIFLPVWILSHATVVTIGGISTPFLLVGIGPAVLILTSIFLIRWWKSKKKILTITILLLIALSNLKTILKENQNGSTIFAIQKDMILKKQLAAIDYTYQQAHSEMFSINTLTSPLWINIVWAYLYKWYGLPQYGYIPQWHGKDQVGQLDSLPSVEESTKLYFLIIEPLGGIPQRYLKQTIAEEDAVSEFLEEKNFGEIRVQKRIKKKQEDWNNGE